METSRLDIETYFQPEVIDQYVTFLKKSKLTGTSIKRKLSSLSSFRKFLLKKKLISNNIQSIQLRQISKPGLSVKPRRHNIFQKFLAQIKSKSPV